MKDTYYKYKCDYNNYVLLIRSGNFYICLNEDAIVMNNIFKYKIIETTNIIKIGFPISIYSKVIEELINKKINYVLIDNDIVDKKKFKENNYLKYSTSNYSMYLNRINKLEEILKNNLNNKNINEMLNKIENIVCMINS